MGGRGGSYIAHSYQEDARSFFGVERANGMYQQWVRSITPQERDALEAYTGDNIYDKINAALRDDEEEFESIDPRLLRQIESIDRAIAKFDLKKSVTVYRWSTNDLVGGLNTAEAINKKLKGRYVQDEGFVSTTAVSGQEFNGNIKYKIMVPRGKGRGAFIAPLSQYEGESEFVINRGTYFKVNGATTNKRGEITVELLVVDKPKWR